MRAAQLFSSRSSQVPKYSVFNKEGKVRECEGVHVYMYLKNSERGRDEYGRKRNGRAEAIEVLTLCEIDGSPIKE